ncbi:MAG: helix-turn-helix domain-containing protein [Myxococcota bacterium]
MVDSPSPSIAARLQQIGLAQYLDFFVRHDVTCDLFPLLTDADLSNMGIGLVGHRKRLLLAFKQPAAPYTELDLADPREGVGPALADLLSTSLDALLQDCRSHSLALKPAVATIVGAVEARFITEALASTGHNVTRTADLLGISRKGLQNKMIELGMRGGNSDESLPG